MSSIIDMLNSFVEEGDFQGLVRYLTLASKDDLLALPTTDLKHYIKSYLSILRGSKVSVQVYENPDHNIALYAYLRILPYDKCIRFYLRNKLLDSHRILPYLPTAIMALQLPCSFIQYHNEESDYPKPTLKQYQELKAKHLKHHPRKAFPSIDDMSITPPPLPTTQDKIDYWMDLLLNDQFFIELEYIEAWLANLDA